MATSTVTKKHFADALAKQHHLTKKQGREMLEDLIGLITKHLKKGERVSSRSLRAFALRLGERMMADVTDLVAQIEERRARLDQVDQAIAEIRRLFAPTKQKRRRRQLRLPLAEPEKKARALRA